MRTVAGLVLAAWAAIATPAYAVALRPSTAKLVARLSRLQREEHALPWGGDARASKQREIAGVMRSLQKPRAMVALLRAREYDLISTLVPRPARSHPDSMAAAADQTPGERAVNQRVLGIAQVRSRAATETKLHQATPYTTTRGIADYAYEHGPFKDRFLADVGTWHGGMKVLDGGAGAGVFFSEVQRELASVPSLVAVGITKPKRVAMKTGPRAKYVKGRLGGADELVETLGPGTFDRIVDTLGAGSYTMNLSGLLRDYGRLLKTGGKMFIAAEFYLAKFQSADGTPLDLPTVLGTLKGFRIEYADNARFCLVRTDEPLEVPALKLVGTESPLDRTFEMRSMVSKTAL